jgi:hypothetical protein
VTLLAARFDRWLAPRWRALATWILIATLTGLIIDTGGTVKTLAWLYDLTGLVLNRFEVDLGIFFPRSIQGLAYVPSILLLLFWFQPVVLRIGLGRGLIWVILGTIFGTTVIAAGDYLEPSDTGALIAGQLLGIPGLAAIGARTRPWMSILASGAATHVALFLMPHNQRTPWYAFAVPNVIYGALMLYSTDPRPDEACNPSDGSD